MRIEDGEGRREQRDRVGHHGRQTRCVNAIEPGSEATSGRQDMNHEKQHKGWHASDEEEVHITQVDALRPPSIEFAWPWNPNSKEERTGRDLFEEVHELRRARVLGPSIPER